MMGPASDFDSSSGMFPGMYPIGTMPGMYTNGTMSGMYRTGTSGMVCQ